MTHEQQKVSEAVMLLEEVKKWQDEATYRQTTQTRRIEDRLIDALAIIKALLEEMKND